ncbi:HNH endonuclease domain-containing protein [Aurantimonas sp. NFXS3]|uniref:HNH endonuclease domain-containing protein n=3 Tax=Aurantimonas TaxID=182269 RepID=UPI003B8DF7D9
MAVDTGPLAGAFRDMTASYKAFWFLSLIEAVRDRAGRASIDLFVPFDEMAGRMLDMAFWPAVTYRLSFGPQDQIHRKLAGLRDDDGNAVKPTFDRERGKGILRYVPDKFLEPWLKAAGRSGREAALELFATPGAVPYRIDKVGIEIERHWFDHIADNLGVMRALGERELIRFLQSRNPTVPGIPEKIGPPDRGGGLGYKRKFWISTLENADPECFYTGRALQGREFSLDHFVPWSFVAHDRIWNLVPMATSLNASKGVRLPNIGLVERMGLTHLALVEKAKRIGGKDIDKVLGEYEADLRVDLQGLEDPDFLSAHREAVAPLMALARRSGFTGRWP